MADYSTGFSGLHFPYSNAYKTEMNIALESLEISGNREDNFHFPNKINPFMACYS